MKRNNKTLRLTEQEFNTLIEESVKNAINEIKWGKVGNALATGAMAASLAIPPVKMAMDSDKQSQYNDPQETEISMVSKDDNDERVTQWMIDHDIEDTPENRQDVWSQMFESKIRRIVRSELSKVL